MRKKSFRIISEIQQGGTEISSKMCNISRITSANCTPEKKSAFYSPKYVKNYMVLLRIVAGPVCPPSVGNELSLILEEKQSKYRYLSRNTLLSPSGDCCHVSDVVDLLFTSGSDAGLENLWLRRLKVTEVTKLIFSISKQCNWMLAIYYRLNDIKGRGNPNIFIRFMI